METIEEFKKAYSITEQDVENLRSVRGLMEKHQDDFIAKFYDFILKFKDTPQFLPDKEIVSRHKEKAKWWFLTLLEGDYNEEYLRTYILPRKFEYNLIQFAKRFAFTVDLLLLFALMISAIFVLGFLGYEVYAIGTGETPVETGILKILGTLLMIWAIGELLSAEIHYHRVGKFAVTAFLTL